MERQFKTLFLRLLQSLARAPKAAFADLAANPPKRILVIRQHDQLGDFLLSTPVFRALRAFYPSAEISVVARPYSAALATHNRYIDQVIVFHDQFRQWNLSYASQFWRQLRQDFDLAVVLNTVSHSLSSDLIARFSGARFILGSDQPRFAGLEHNFFYNLIAPYRDLPLPQSEKNLDIVRAIGADTADHSEHMTLLQEERQHAAERLQKSGWNAERPLVALHPGAGKILNRWPAQYFAQVANRLAAMSNCQFFVTWGPAEDELATNLMQNLQTEAISFQCRDIRELAAILSHASLFICNDTGVMHLAAAVDTPLIAIFGPTPPEEWKPVGDRFVSLRAPDHRCESVAVEEVVSQAMGMLKMYPVAEKAG